MTMSIFRLSLLHLFFILLKTDDNLYHVMRATVALVHCEFVHLHVCSSIYAGIIVTLRVSLCSLKGTSWRLSTGCILHSIFTSTHNPGVRSESTRFMGTNKCMPYLNDTRRNARVYSKWIARNTLRIRWVPQAFLFSTNLNIIMFHTRTDISTKYLWCWY